MNRRGFFSKMFGAVAAAVMATPIAKALAGKDRGYYSNPIFTASCDWTKYTGDGKPISGTVVPWKLRWDGPFEQLETARRRGAVEFGSEYYLWMPASEHYLCKRCGAVSQSDGSFEQLTHKPECPSHTEAREAVRNTHWRPIAS